MKFLFSIFFALILFAFAQNQINIRDIQVLTFQKGMFTTARRVSPIPQLKRVGGAVTTSYEPSTVQCKNVGWDGSRVNWKCQADMDEKYRFGSIEVVCEGFNHPGDQYVLVGSCGLEYTLEYTTKGKSRQNRQNYRTNQGHYRHTAPEYVDRSSGFGTFLFFFILFFVLIGVCVYCSGTGSASSTGAPGPSTFQPIYPTTTYTSGYPTTHTTYVNTDSGYTSGFVSGYSMGSMNNRSYDTSSSYSSGSSYQDYEEDDSTTRTATGYGGTRTR